MRRGDLVQWASSQLDPIEAFATSGTSKGNAFSISRFTAAATLAAEILALKHDHIRRAYDSYRESLASG